MPSHVKTGLTIGRFDLPFHHDFRRQHLGGRVHVGRSRGKASLQTTTDDFNTRDTAKG